MLAVTLSFFYVYLINDSVFSVAARKSNEEKIAALEAEIASLESSYMAEAGKIDMKLASSLGFVDSSKETTYAYLSLPAVSLLTAQNEI